MDEAVRYVAVTEAWLPPYLDGARTVRQVPEKSAIAKIGTIRVGVPDPLPASAAPVAVAPFYLAPFSSSQLLASVRFSSGPQQPQHALVHAASLFLPAVVAPGVLLPLAEQRVYVLSHVFGQACAVPPSHPIRSQRAKKDLSGLAGTHLFLFSFCCEQSFGFRCCHCRGALEATVRS